MILSLLAHCRNLYYFQIRVLACLFSKCYHLPCLLLDLPCIRLVLESLPIIGNLIIYSLLCILDTWENIQTNSKYHIFHNILSQMIETSFCARDKDKMLLMFTID